MMHTRQTLPHERVAAAAVPIKAQKRSVRHDRSAHDRGVRAPRAIESADPVGEHARAVKPRPRLLRRTLQHNVYDYLREALMSGEYSPGEHLTVRGVAAAIGTSAMPVREAFRRL